MIPPTPKHLDRSERRIRIAALRAISFNSIIANAHAEAVALVKAEMDKIERTEAPHQNEGDAP